MAARTTGNTKSKGIPGGEREVRKNGPNISMATIIKYIAMEPWPHTSGSLIFLQKNKKQLAKMRAPVGNGNVWCCPPIDTTGTQSQLSLMDHR
ncbi:hypothetical protein CR513_41231, partial [Mucuna pruriens]